MERDDFCIVIGFLVLAKEERSELFPLFRQLIKTGAISPVIDEEISMPPCPAPKATGETVRRWNGCIEGKLDLRVASEIYDFNRIIITGLYLVPANRWTPQFRTVFARVASVLLGGLIEKKEPEFARVYREVLKNMDVALGIYNETHGVHEIEIGDSGKRDSQLNYFRELMLFWSDQYSLPDDAGSLAEDRVFALTGDDVITLSGALQSSFDDKDKMDLRAFIRSKLCLDPAQFKEIFGRSVVAEDEAARSAPKM